MMRVDGRVRIPAVGTWLPATRESTAQALAAGLLTPQDVASSGYEELPVSVQLAAPEMAVLAAKGVLDRARVPAADLDMTVHAWIYHQGHDLWSPAHFIAAELGARGAQPVGVQQMCNGGAAALEMVITRMLADPEARQALVTTADSFCAPGFDRWRSDYGVVYGDGATAAVVVRRPDPGPGGRPADGLDLLSITTLAAPELEWMHRGEDAFSPAGRMVSSTIDIRRTKKVFLAAVGKQAFADTVDTRVREVLRRGLSDAGVTPDDPRLRLVALPRIGVAAQAVYLPAVAAVLSAAPIDLGRRTGHLGAGDALANLAAVLDDGLLGPGELGVVLSAGAGFTWTCIVVRRSGDLAMPHAGRTPS